jgi:hypothetical protein
MNVICIGMYNNKGIFNNLNWKGLIEWIKHKYNAVEIYTRMDLYTLQGCFESNTFIVEGKIPDTTMDYKSYRIICDDNVWNKLRDMNYNIDDNCISHMYFFYKEQYKGCLEIQDYENYVFLVLTKEEEKELSNLLPLLDENEKTCNINRGDINTLADGDEWKPLGC